MKLKFDNRHALAISKVLFAVYNVLMIWLLNLYSEETESGRLLFILGVVLLSAAISRMGSDYYWVSSDSDDIVINPRELLFLAVTSCFFSAVSCVLLELPFFENFVIVLATILLVNLLQFIGRIYQKNERHIMSLMVFSLAPAGLAIPFFILFPDVGILNLIALSGAFFVVITAVPLIGSVRIRIEEESIFERVHYLPMIIFGFVNQNIIAVLGGLTSNAGSVSLLVLLQRVGGLISWPLVFFLQQELKTIKAALKDSSTFLLCIKDYIVGNKTLLLMFMSVSVVLGVAVLMYFDKFNLILLSSLVLILLASTINSLFGFLQYQMGAKSLGWGMMVGIVFSIIASSSPYLLSDTPYLIGAISYFIFHVCIHTFTFFTLYRRLNANV